MWREGEGKRVARAMAGFLGRFSVYSKAHIKPRAARRGEDWKL
jgi:hypothetical protein